jgi:hypothetical protein
MGDSRIKDVSSLLSSFFDAEKRMQGGRYADLFGSWKRIAGERLAAHSRVQDIENGILIVEAEHPGWVQLLQLKQAEIQAEATRLFPELGIRGISFRLARGGTGANVPSAGSGGAQGQGGRDARPGPFGPGGRDPGEGPEEGVAEEEMPRHEASLEDIGDPALRALLGELKKTVDGGR